jgi:hypothetical protein
MVAMNPSPIPADFRAITPTEWELHQHDGLWIPMCTALTNRGTWCKNPIFHGQIYAWWGDTPIVSLAEWLFIEAGLCTLHWKRRATDEQIREMTLKVQAVLPPNA